MSTSIARGRVAVMALGIQTDFLTPAASGSYRNLGFYKTDLAEKQPLTSDPLLGVNPNNSRDQVAPSPSLPEHGGSIDIPLCWNQIGHWLRAVFGAPATTGTTDRTHVFASGANTLPAMTAEVSKLANDFRQHVGLVAQGISFDFEDKSGFQMAKVDFVGRGENLFSASQAGALLAVALDQIPATGGVVRVNAVQVGSCRQGKLTYTTGMEAERYIDGSGRAGAVVPMADSAAMGEIRLRHTSTAFDTLAINGTVQSVEIEFQQTATRSLLFAMPACRFERPTTSIEGPGGIESVIPFRAHQSASGPMLSVTLKNQITSY